MELQASVQDVVVRICSYLECTNKMLASLIGVTESTLSKNLENKIESVQNTKTGRRLLKITAAVLHLQTQGIGSRSILKIITEPVLEDYRGNYYSIKSAIISDDFTLETILTFVNQAKEEIIWDNMRHTNDFITQFDLQMFIPLEESKKRA